MFNGRVREERKDLDCRGNSTQSEKREKREEQWQKLTDLLLLRIDSETNRHSQIGVHVL